MKRLASVLIVLCLASAAYAATVVQSLTTPVGGASSLTFTVPPTNGNYLTVTSFSASLAPSGVAPWKQRIHPNYYEFVAIGPFVPNAQGKYTVKLTNNANTKINATLTEFHP